MHRDRRRRGGRGGGIRTPTRGFGDRWSAVKPTPLHSTSSVTCRGQAWQEPSPPLLDLLVGHVLAAEGAELLQLNALRGGFLVLHAGVVLALAVPTLKGNLFSRH